MSLEDKMGPEGVQSLFDELGIDALDIVSLIFAWKLDAAVACEFTRDEFVRGCMELGADSIRKLKTRICTHHHHALIQQSSRSWTNTNLKQANLCVFVRFFVLR